MGRNFNQDHFKVQGSPVRSRELARLYRKRFNAKGAALKQKASFQPGPPHLSPQKQREHAQPETVKRGGEARAQERLRERVDTSLPERVSWLLPREWGKRVRKLWRNNRRPLGVAAGLVLAPLTIARVLRRMRA